MGLFDFIKSELIDIIEYQNDDHDSIVWRFPREDNEIKNGAQLIVRESQVAVFVNQGQIADIFEPGQHTLTTKNVPVLATLQGWKYGFDSPFKAEVYFVSSKLFVGKKWGTPNGIKLRDTDFGIIRLSAIGTFNFKVTDPKKFITEVSGTDGNFSVKEIHSQLRTIIVTRLADAIGELKIGALDLASQQNEISDFLQKQLIPDFEEMGLDMPKLLIQNFNLPEEVEKAIDTRASMGALGNMNTYTQFKAANAMEVAANNPGEAGSTMGMGLGFAMGNQMMNAMGSAQQANTPAAQSAPAQNAPTPPPIPVAFQVYVAVNGQQTGPFDLNTLKQMKDSGQFNEQSTVWKQGMSGWQAASTIPELSTLFQSQTPPPPPPPIG